MQYLNRAAVAALGALALAGCAGKPTDSAAFEKQAQEGVRVLLAAFNTGDVEAILAQYAPDAEVMAPTYPRAVGHEAIRTLVTELAGQLQAGQVTLVPNDDDKAAASGELGYHSGSYVVKDASGAVVDSGNYLAVMRRQPDGRWLMIRDIWNADRKAAPAEMPAEAAAADAAATPATN